VVADPELPIHGANKVPSVSGGYGVSGEDTGKDNNPAMG
jgi:hypothetical protein